MRTAVMARSGFSLVDLKVLFVLLTVLLGMMFPAMQKAREQANRLKCQQNLKAIGLALHRYEAVHRHLPPRGTNRPPRHGWVALLLPHLGKEELARGYSYDHDWDEDVNAKVIGTHLEGMQCPSAPTPNRLLSGVTRKPNGGASDPDRSWSGSCSDYVVSSSVDGSARQLGLPPSMDLTGAFTTNVPRRMNDFVDGMATTLMLVEQAGRPELWRKGVRSSDKNVRMSGAWAHNTLNQTEQHGHSEDGRTYPGPCAINCSNFRGIYAFHPGLANVCFVDGSVRTLREGMDIFLLLALTTKNGGEVVGNDDF